MRKLYFFLLIITLSISAYPQLNDVLDSTYTPLKSQTLFSPGTTQKITNPANTWNIATNHVCHSATDNYDYWTTKYYFVGNNVVRKNIDYTQIFSSDDSTLSDSTVWRYVREKNDSVFLFDGNKEILAFDFNLMPGDTMILNFFESDDIAYHITLDSIKNMVFNDGKSNKAHYISYCNYYKEQKGNNENSVNDIWVKHIGSLKQGLEYQYEFTTGLCGSLKHLLCFHQNEDLIYQNPNFNTCVKHNPLSIEETELAKIELYPNPNNGKFTLYLGNFNKPYRFYLYDIQGNEVEHQMICNNENQFDFSYLKPGLYTYFITCNDGFGKNGKIVIQQ